MDTMKLYERVCERAECDHARFLSALNYAADELCAMYGETNVLCGARREAARVGQDMPLREQYGTAVLDDILYLLTRDERFKTDFCAHAEYAYRSVWREQSRGRRIPREVW